MAFRIATSAPTCWAISSVLCAPFLYSAVTSRPSLVITLPPICSAGVRGVVSPLSGYFDYVAVIYSDCFTGQGIVDTEQGHGFLIAKLHS